VFKALRSAFGDPSSEERRLAALRVLSDPQAPLQEAASALLTLGQYSDPQAIAAVRAFATNALAHSHLQHSAAEAFTDIVLRDGLQDTLILGLTAESAATLLSYLSAHDALLGQTAREKLGL
jgi:hypothetical protein